MAPLNYSHRQAHTWASFEMIIPARNTAFMTLYSEIFLAIVQHESNELNWNYDKKLTIFCKESIEKVKEDE